MFAWLNKADKTTLVGISVSAVSLLALASLAALCLIAFSMSYFGILLSGSAPSIRWVIGTGFAMLCGWALCVPTFWAWRALNEERLWALWIARTWATLLAVSGAFDLYRMQRPHTPLPDEYFGVAVDPVLILGGAVWLLYLSLPKVRERFRTQTQTV